MGKRMRPINPKTEGLKRFDGNGIEIAEVVPTDEIWCAMSKEDLDIIRSGLFIAIPYMHQVGVDSGDAPESGWGKRVAQAAQLRDDVAALVSETGKNH